MMEQPGDMRHSTLSTTQSSQAADEERPFGEDENANDTIEDYEQQPEEAAVLHDGYPSKDPDSDDEASEDGDFKLVQPYKSLICGSWAEGRGRAIVVVIIAAYSLWAFIVDFQRALPLFIVEMIVLGIVLTSKATDILIPEKKADLTDRTVEFCTDTLVCGASAPGSPLATILFRQSGLGISPYSRIARSQLSSAWQSWGS